jgi:two-component sensor histidine kinase
MQTMVDLESPATGDDADPRPPGRDDREALGRAKDIAFACAFPATILWGPARTMVFNPAFDAAGIGHAPVPGALADPGFWPADPGDLLAIELRVMAGESVAAEVALADAPLPGAERWFSLSASPLRTPDGKVAGILTIGIETSDAVRARAAAGRAVVAEAALRHRLRNVVAVIRSIARRGATAGLSSEDYAARLDGRIGAFTRTLAELSREGATGFDLAVMLSGELLAHVVQEGERLSFNGPPIRLDGRIAQRLGLAFHELAANAVEFGALAHREGHVAVSWRRVEGGLQFDWIESGSPEPVAPPTTRGFGLELLERTLAYDLNAEAVASFEPQGFRYRLTLPLPGGASA